MTTHQNQAGHPGSTVYCIAYLTRAVGEVRMPWGNSRLRANIIQGVLLMGAFYLASRDVERTMNQRPVSREQNAALGQYIKHVRRDDENVKRVRKD